MKEYKLSIVIPYRNIIECLTNALDSILIDDLSDVQVIVVDDNSDENLKRYNELKTKYKDKIEFYEITTQKRGAGAARNIGLKHALGKWVLFLDADDEFTNDWYSVVKTYFNSNYDIVYFEPISKEEAGSRHLRYKRRVENYIKNKNQKTEDKLRYEFIVPWSKLIRTDLIKKNNIEFEEVIYGNDNMFSVKTGNAAKKIFASEEKIYKVCDRSDSLTKQKTIDAVYEREKVHCRRYNYVKKAIGTKRFKKLDVSVIGFVCLCKLALRAIKGKCEYKEIKKFIELFYEQNVRMFPSTAYIFNNFGRITKRILRIDKVY